MKKNLVFICLFVSAAVFAQNEKVEGDAMAASENYSGAAMMYRACMEKDEQCLMKLFMLLYENKVEPQSADELYQLINPPARRGNTEAQFYLGKMFQSGTGISKNESEALNWFKKSAGKNNIKAQYELALIYHHGQGVKTNIKTAKKWYKKCADQGHFDAQNTLTELTQNDNAKKERKIKVPKLKK
jgi:FOG: TPR repeat, SEL1 subfamily